MTLRAATVVPPMVVLRRPAADRDAIAGVAKVRRDGIEADDQRPVEGKAAGPGRVAYNRPRPGSGEEVHAFAVSDPENVRKS